MAFQGQYWGEPCRFAGVVKSYKIEEGFTEVSLLLSGTGSERLQNWGASHPTQPLRVQVCSRSCGGERVADDLGHGHLVKKVTSATEDPWMTSLQLPRGDDLADLRRGLKDLQAKEVDSEQSESTSRKRKKKKEKTRRKLAAEKGKGGVLEEKEKAPEKTKEKKKKKTKKKKRSVSSSDSSSNSKEGEKIRIRSQELVHIFGDTGLDPCPKKRRKIRRKVRVSLKKNKDRESGTSNSSSSGSLASDDHLFREDKKVRMIAKRAPGALSAQAAEELKGSLVTASGQVWGMSEGTVHPLATHYFRSVLKGKMTGGIAREALTLAVLIDNVLQGKVAEGINIAFQRLKSLELIANGTDFRVAQKIELAPLEIDSMASMMERSKGGFERKQTGNAVEVSVWQGRCLERRLHKRIWKGALGKEGRWCKRRKEGRQAKLGQRRQEPRKGGGRQKEVRQRSAGGSLEAPWNVGSLAMQSSVTIKA